MKKRLDVLGRLVAAAVTLGLGAPAGANTITIDFEDGPYASAGPYGPESGTNNFLSQHFVFSPSCHFDHLNQWNGPNGRAPAPFGYWLGYDASGCYDDPSGQAIGNNHNYLGPGGPIVQSPRVFVAQEFGATFSLESLVFATIAPDTGGIQVYSSKGGFFSTDYSDGVWVEHSFSGDVWRNVEWLEFRGGGGGAPAGFDNLRLSSNAIPESGSLALLGLALAAMWLQSRRPLAAVE